ncbi:hypothetical protein GQ44DRAFT_771933 [Phaeosphaeriaceae sp. PMI808]|nr:hypothetical protein GQ44DRAFT_771933 [Phaeosphaeriaceae sp. PMI808]
MKLRMSNILNRQKKPKPQLAEAKPEASGKNVEGKTPHPRSSRIYNQTTPRNVHEPQMSKLTNTPNLAQSSANPYYEPYSFASIGRTNTVSNAESPVKIARSTESTHPGFILVGIDFGTTFSGVAWAFSKQPDDIQIITNWDSVEPHNSDKGKAPTKIAYERRNLEERLRGANDQNRLRVDWGYGVEEANAAEWFKLLLLDEAEMDEGQSKSPQIQRAISLLQEAGKTPVQAVADYLRMLWLHAVSNMERSLGKEMIEGLQFQVVCTVPAVWNSAAVNKMRTAAQDAGITSQRPAGLTSLEFVSEPEAAALATFEDLKARPTIKQGDTYVVCDAGGGTVDLISYKVTELNPLQLDECVEGSGKLCGAVFLDEDFEKMIAQRLGDAWDVPESIKREFMDAQWENGIKRAFEDQDKKWKITIPYPCVMRGAPPSITLDKGHVKDTFEHVVSQIRALVNDQISAVEEKENKLPKGIILVGGFGSCRYIFNVLRRENELRGIEVLQSSGYKPWTAICRGAVLSALTNSLLRKPVVRSRILRCNYGTDFMTPFDPRYHSESDRFFYERAGRDYAVNQLRWYLKRGDIMSSTKPVRHPWVEYVPCDIPKLNYEFNKSIYTCRARDPPSRITAGVEGSCRLQTDNPIDISSIVASIGNDGKQYKDIHHEVQMKVIGTAVEFAILYKGNQVGRSQLVAEVDDSIYSTPSTDVSGPTLRTLSPRHSRQHSDSYKKWNAIAMYNYYAEDTSHHSFVKGDRFRITGAGSQTGFLLAERNGVTKTIPDNYISPV